MSITFAKEKKIIVLARVVGVFGLNIAKFMFQNVQNSPQRLLKL